jgi:hypothetical protein
MSAATSSPWARFLTFGQVFFTAKAVSYSDAVDQPGGLEFHNGAP